MIVLDTHALVWSVSGDMRLGKATRTQIETTARTGEVLVSAVTPWETALLTEKGRLRLSQDVGSWIQSALAIPGVRLAPIEPAIAVDSVRLPSEFHADPADRIIIATARHSNAPLVTPDSAMLEYAAAGHLQAVDASALRKDPSL